MSKAFINALANGLLALIVLQGCALTGPPGDGSDAADTAVSGTSAADGGPAQAGMPAPAVSPGNRERFERATAQARDGRLVEAEALLLQITDDQPELAGPWINLARVFIDQQRHDDAVRALQQAVRANPANCAARTELGVLLRRRGEFEAAEAHYLACLEHQNDYQAAYLNLGILYDLYLGRLNDALAAYERYQSLTAEPDRQVHVWVVDLQRRLGT